MQIMQNKDFGTIFSSSLEAVALIKWKRFRDKGTWYYWCSQ